MIIKVKSDGNTPMRRSMQNSVFELDPCRSNALIPTMLHDDQTFADMNGPLHYWGPAPAMRARLHPGDDLLVRRLRARMLAAGGDTNGIVRAVASALAASPRSSNAA
jgi:hypothetical protein